MVHMLTQRQLARVLFPVGVLTKAEVRTRAAQLNLRTAAKPDSQDVCFITRAGGRQAFLGDRIPLHPGRVVEVGTKAPLGSVSAVELVTVGQRRGFGGFDPGSGRRYAVDVDVATATVTLGRAADLLTERVGGPRAWAGSTDRWSPAGPSRSRPAPTGGPSRRYSDRTRCASVSRSGGWRPARASCSTTATWCSAEGWRPDRSLCSTGTGAGSRTGPVTGDATTEDMADGERRRLRRSGLSGLAALAGVYVVVIAIDRGRDVAAFSVVYAVVVLWPAWRYVVAPLIDSARGRAGIVNGPVRLAKSAETQAATPGSSTWAPDVCGWRPRLSFEDLMVDRPYRLRYAPITRVVLDVEAVAEG